MTTAVVLLAILNFPFLVAETYQNCIDLKSDETTNGFDKEFDYSSVSKFKRCLQKGLECSKTEKSSREKDELKKENSVKDMHCYVDIKGCEECWTHGRIGALLSNVPRLQSFRFGTNFTKDYRIAGVRACLRYELEKILTAEEYEKCIVDKGSLSEILSIITNSHQFTTESLAELTKKLQKIIENESTRNYFSSKDLGKIQSFKAITMIDRSKEAFIQTLKLQLEFMKRYPEVFSAFLSKPPVCCPTTEDSARTEAAWIARHLGRAFMLLMESGAKLQKQNEDEKVLKRNIERLQRVEENCRSEVGNLSAIIRTKNDTISELEKEAKNRSAEIATLLQEKRKCKESNAGLNANLTRQEDHLSRKIERLTMRMKAQNESLTDQIKHLEEQILEFKAKNGSLIQKNAELNAEVKKLKADLQVVKYDLNYMNLTLTNDILNLTAKNEDLTSDNDDLRLNVSKLNTRGRELEGKLNTRSSEISFLKNETQNMTVEILQLNQTISDMTVKISHLEENVSNANALTAHLNGNLSRLNTELASCQDTQIRFPEYHQKEETQDKDVKVPNSDKKLSENVVSKNSLIVAIIFVCMFVVSTLFLLGYLCFVKAFKGKSENKTESSGDSEDNKGTPPRKTTKKHTTWPRRRGVGPKTGAKKKGQRKEKSTKETVKESSKSDWIADVSRVTSRDQKDISLSKPVSARGSQRSRSVIPTIPLH